MRHLRPFAALLAIAAITAACSAGPGSSSGGESSQGGEASQPAASTGGGDGGGGGGGGANGSITYEITGDYQASGEEPFLAGGISLWVESAGGWVANFADPTGAGSVVILLNTQAAEGTSGQIFSYGDGTIILAAGSGETGMGCTFNLDENDASGLKGSLDCTSAIAANATTGAQLQVQVHAEWDAHP